MSDGPIILEGDYFTPGSARATPARLMFSSVDDRRPVLSHGDTERAVDVLAVTDRIGAVARRLTLSDNALFSTNDNDAVDRLAVARGGAFSRVSRIEKVGWHLPAFVVACVLLVAGLIVYGVPAAAKVAVWATPPKVAEWMDASSLATVDRILAEPSKLPPTKRETLQKAFDELVAANDIEPDPVLYFRDGDRIGPNAFALPGGSVVLTDQLVELMSEDEIVAVMAHELAHVRHSHGLNQMYRALGVAATLSILSGDLGSASEEVLGGASILSAMASSREMELEADADGVAMLRKAGRDPTALASGLKKLFDKLCGNRADACAETGWFSSHPGSAQRLEALNRLTGG